MQHTNSRWSLAAAVALLALIWPSAGAAQTVSGQARAVQATFATAGTTTFADTGTLGGATDAREASQQIGSIPSLLATEALHAATLGWSDQVASEASVANLALTINGTTITADFVMARILSAKSTDAAVAAVDGLFIDGVPITVTGTRNQQVAISGGTLIINEQKKGSSGTVVNALHVVMDGTADVVIASASAKAQ